MGWGVWLSKHVVYSLSRLRLVARFRSAGQSLRRSSLCSQEFPCWGWQLHGSCSTLVLGSDNYRGQGGSSVTVDKISNKTLKVRNKTLNLTGYPMRRLGHGDGCSRATLWSAARNLVGVLAGNGCPSCPQPGSRVCCKEGWSVRRFFKGRCGGGILNFVAGCFHENNLCGNSIYMLVLGH